MELHTDVIAPVILGTTGYTFSIDFIEILREGPVVFDIVALVLSGDSLEHGEW
ncbi:MAG: hypothetical protein QM484_15235 [Woeseiaceae bacterium]